MLLSCPSRNLRRIYLFDGDDSGGGVRAVFELSLDGSNGEPVSREVVLGFEQTVFGSTFASVNELLPVPEKRAVLVAVLLK